MMTLGSTNTNRGSLKLWRIRHLQRSGSDGFEYAQLTIGTSYVYFQNAAKVNKRVILPTLVYELDDYLSFLLGEPIKKNQQFDEKSTSNLLFLKVPRLKSSKNEAC